MLGLPDISLDIQFSTTINRKKDNTTTHIHNLLGCGNLTICDSLYGLYYWMDGVAVNGSKPLTAAAN